MRIDWVIEAKDVFDVKKPEHFTNYLHCEECAEHDVTLLNNTVDTIGLEELGNPGWDPICFCSSEGKKYYMPSFIRLSLDTMNDEFYFGQLLFHLEGDGKGNELYRSCNEKQRAFILKFVDYVILHHSDKLDYSGYQDEALKVHEIWSAA